MVPVPPSGSALLPRLVGQTAALIIVLGAVLFAAGGTIRWPAAWVFLGAMGVTSLGLGLWLARRDPGLLAERLSSPWQSKQTGADRVFMASAAVVWFAWLVLIALDAGRWRWSSVPVWLQGAGAATVLFGVGLIARVFAVNSFAAPVVKLQPGQVVATGGPYRFVRHPMYSGGLLYFAGIALLLGSWLGLLAVPLLAAGLSLRIGIEERALLAGLPGYAAYAARVRWRLVPGVW